MSFVTIEKSVPLAVGGEVKRVQVYVQEQHENICNQSSVRDPQKSELPELHACEGI
jgi:hypothetical protein